VRVELSWSRRGWASDATHSRVAAAGSGDGCSRGGPELGRAAAGDGALLLGAAGGGEDSERLYHVELPVGQAGSEQIDQFPRQPRLRRAFGVRVAFRDLLASRAAQPE
jgi:hypothetical protein